MARPNFFSRMIKSLFFLKMYENSIFYAIAEKLFCFSISFNFKFLLVFVPDAVSERLNYIFVDEAPLGFATTALLPAYLSSSPIHIDAVNSIKKNCMFSFLI